MSAPMKRPCDDGENNLHLTKKISTANSDEERRNSFIEWSNRNAFCLSPKVTVGRERSCAQYGMIAVDDVDEGECLFQIPRKMLLHPDTSEIAELLKEERNHLESDSGWVPLLVTLMFEYNNPQSLWRPYLDLVPDFKELDLPMFWQKKDRDTLLLGTGVLEAVQRDLVSLTKEFNTTVLPFVKKHQDKFSPVCEDLEFYKKMVAFVMAYSFTEPLEDEDEEEDEDEKDGSSAPMMVPMADILNHVALNNAHLVFGKEALKMVATKHIEKGSEVFNTYGHLSNMHLLHMYGFAEEYPHNVYDTVDISAETLKSEASSMPLHKADPDLMEDKWTFLMEQEIIGEDDVFVLGTEGILTDDTMFATLKVCVMSKEEFTEHRSKDGWSDDEDEEERDDSLSFESIKKLEDSWKGLLLSIANSTLKRYSSTLEEDEKRLKSSQLCDREKFALYTQYGQKKLLYQLIEICR